MPNKKSILTALWLALGEFAYISLVATIMMNGENFFGLGPKILGMLLFLTLFVVSAAVSGALILGKPILLYLDGRRKEAVTLFGLTLGWLLVFLVIIFASLMVLK